MKNVILQKHDGLVETIDVKPENVEDLRVANLKVKHKCAENCANAYTPLCPKIADLEKKTIDKYDFITEGKQLYDDNGEMVFFIVSECLKYVKALKKEYQLNEKIQNKRLLQSMYTNRFNAETIEEALKIQEDLIRRGQLRDVRGVLSRTRNRSYED